MLRNIGLWILLISLPIWGGAIAIDPKSNIDNEHVTLDFELHGGLILLQASVDGVIGNYLFDSGAPSMVLNQKVLSGTESFTSIDGDLDAQESIIQELRIGGIKRNSVAAWNMDLTYVEDRLGIQIHGLIGADILDSYDLMIDYKKSQLSFINSEKLKELKPVFSKVIAVPLISYYENLPVVEVNLNGDLLRMSFDTGAGVSVVSDDFIKPKRTKLDNLNLGLLQVESVPVLSRDMTGFFDKDGQCLDGILSVNALNTDRVLISNKKNMIYLFWDKPVQ